MEDKNKWKNWSTAIDIPAHMFIEYCSWNENTLTVLLRSGDQSKKVSIEFHEPIAYRFHVNESHRAATWFNSIFPSNMSHIRYSEKSEYIEWLKNEDGNVHDFSNLKHFLVGSEEILEVLCKIDPVIKDKTE